MTIRKVLIIQRSLVEYRLPFFKQLRESLLEDEIELNLAYGEIENHHEWQQCDVSQYTWAHRRPNLSLGIGPINFIWQPCLDCVPGSDLVIVEQANKLLINYYLILRRILKGFKLGFWGHGRDFNQSESSAANRFKYFLLQKCDWWFAYTEGVRDFLVSKNYPGPQITSVQNAIDTKEIRRQYQEVSTTEVENLSRRLDLSGEQVAIFCGSMYPEKRIEFVLEACRMIRSAIPDFEMIFIGSGVDVAKVSAISLTEDWVHYVGPKFGADRVKYFKIAKVQLMPSAVGLGVLDSFAMETPLVTTDHGYHGPEIRYLRHGENGWITPDEVAAYARMVVEVLRGTNYEAVVRNCRADATKYTIENMVDNFKNGIIKCLEYEKELGFEQPAQVRSIP